MPLPETIYWRLRHVVLISIFGPPADLAEARDHDGCMANHVVCRRREGRPLGATGWRLSPSDPWQPMETCPIPETPAADRRQGGLPNGKAQQSKYGR